MVAKRNPKANFPKAKDAEDAKQQLAQAYTP